IVGSNERECRAFGKTGSLRDPKTAIHHARAWRPPVLPPAISGPTCFDHPERSFLRLISSPFASPPLRYSGGKLAMKRNPKRKGKLPKWEIARISDKWKTSSRFGETKPLTTNGAHPTRGLLILIPYRDYVCVTIGRYWYLFKRLTAVSAGRFYRFEHIVTHSSGKVVAK